MTREDGDIFGFNDFTNFEHVYTVLRMLSDLEHRKTTFGDDHFAQFYMLFLAVFEQRKVGDFFFLEKSLLSGKI